MMGLTTRTLCRNPEWGEKPHGSPTRPGSDPIVLVAAFRSVNPPPEAGMRP